MDAQPLVAAVLGGWLALVLLSVIAWANEEHTLVVGSPGGGKSFGCAWEAVRYPGSVVVLDPHRMSLARLVLEHDPSPNLLYDQLSDLDRHLSYDLLKPSAHPDPRVRAVRNQRKIAALVEIMTRRRGGDVAGTPLLEEWLVGLLTLFVSQARPKPLSLLPYGFMPGTPEFDALLRDCTDPLVRYRFEQLRRLTPRGLRSEVGSVVRLVSAVFRSPSFLARCDGGLDLGRFLSLPRARLVVERGEEIDEDAMRTIMGAIVVLVVEFCESRPKPFPPVRLYLDECNNAATAGVYEAKKAAETRKYGLYWEFICQWLNFVGGHDGFLSVCGRKAVYRVADRKLARLMAEIVEPGLPRTDETRPQRLEWVTDEIMTLQPGWRIVSGRSGSRFEQVPLLKDPWPNWRLPGGGSLRDAKLKEKLCRIYQRPEYLHDRPSPSSSGPDEPPPTSSPESSSPAERLKRRGKRPAGPSSSSDGGGESG